MPTFTKKELNLFAITFQSFVVAPFTLNLVLTGIYFLLFITAMITCQDFLGSTCVPVIYHGNVSALPIESIGLICFYISCKKTPFHYHHFSSTSYVILFLIFIDSFKAVDS